MAMVAYVLVRHVYDGSRNHYLYFLGCGYFWVALIDVMHTLVYKGMYILPSVATANEPTQLWIVARYSEAALLIIAPVFASRPLRRDPVFALFGVIATGLVALVMSGNFPDCFIEGSGLTTFKIYSEYAIIGLLIGAMAHLWRRRAAFDTRIVSAILVANLFAICAEAAFTQYASVYGPANLFGHIFKLFSWWAVCCVLTDFAFGLTAHEYRPVAAAPHAVPQFYRMLAAGAVIVPSVILGVFAWQDYNATMRAAEREGQAKAEIYTGHAFNIFQTHELIGELVNIRLGSMSWDEIEHSAAVHDFLYKITVDFPQVQAAWLADGQGVVRNASVQLPASRVSVSDRDYFQALRYRREGMAIGSLVEARVLKGWNFNTARRRVNINGDFNGIIVLTIFENYFSDLWRQTESGSRTVVSLVRSDGKFLARVPAVVPLALAIPANATVFEFARNAPSGTYRALSTTDGIERLYSFRKLPNYDVIMIYGVSLDDEVLGRWREDMAVYGALFGIAVAALLLLTFNAQRGTRLAETTAQNIVLEQRVRERTAALEATNRELESFTYSASHDLRAPLRSIDGFINVLEEDYADRLDEDGRDALRRVSAAAKRMDVLIDDLLQLSRLTRAELNAETVDLSKIARGIAAELKARDPARDVVFEIPPKLEVRGDLRLLTVALDNLLGNAWKFTGKNPQARIELGTMAKDGLTVYFVRDDGAGFDMANATNLFTPFHRLHSVSEFPGTGIGLATVRRIVQRHGGRAWGEGETGKGATFYFTLSTSGENNG
jgi:signal transduction histidine kinase